MHVMHIITCRLSILCMTPSGACHNRSPKAPPVAPKRPHSLRSGPGYSRCPDQMRSHWWVICILLCYVYIARYIYIYLLYISFLQIIVYTYIYMCVDVCKYIYIYICIQISETKKMILYIVIVLHLYMYRSGIIFLFKHNWSLVCKDLETLGFESTSYK